MYHVPRNEIACRLEYNPRFQPLANERQQITQKKNTDANFAQHTRFEEMKINRNRISIKIIVLLLASFATASLFAQDIQFKVHNIILPQEIQNPNYEFSGLYISGEKLFLLPENRMGKGIKENLFTVRLSDLEHQLKDSTFPLPFNRIQIQNLNLLQEKINANGQYYEGFEAILIKEDSIYLSVETTTQSTFAYLLRGHLKDSSLIMDIEFLLPIPKPTRKDGSQIYNAGFESLEFKDRDIILLYEYNNFPDENHGFRFDYPFISKKLRPTLLIESIPFRLTDITQTAAHQYTGINYFYKGAGADTLYRPIPNDIKQMQLVNDDLGYHNYCRLITIDINDQKINWQSLWEFPIDYQSYNWEGIAAYHNGYFIINDRYTPDKPYRSTLIFLSREEKKDSVNTLH